MVLAALVPANSTVPLLAVKPPLLDQLPYTWRLKLEPVVNVAAAIAELNAHFYRGRSTEKTTPNIGMCIAAAVMLVYLYTVYE